MADKRVYQTTEISSVQDKDHDWLVIDGDGDGTSQDKLQKMTFANLAQEVLDVLGITASDAELNKLDGVTSTTGELNILDGVTSDKNELNILDGVTSTTAELNILDGVTSTTAELNILDGVTSDKDELNILDGVTATTAELNYTAGVNSQLAGMDEQEAEYTDAVTGAATTLTKSGLYECDTTDNAISLTMPAITNSKSESFIITLETDGGDNVTIVDNGSDSGFIKADGTTTGTSIELDSEGNVVYLKSPCVSGGKWMILGGEGYVLNQ